MDDIVDRLRTRAKIRRQISTRKSVQEGKADRIADLLDEAAAEIERLRIVFGIGGEPCKEEIHHGPGHQSHSTCDKVGPHEQHRVSTHDFYWHSKPGKTNFSGYFDESPERPM